MSEAERKNVKISMQEESSQSSMISQSDQKLVKIQQSEGGTLACCFTDGVIELFATDNCEHFEVKSEVKDPVTDILWFDTNQLLCSQSKVISLFDVEKKVPISEFIGHSKTIFSVAKNIYNNLIASGGEDHTIMLWDVRQKTPVNVMLAHSRNITSLQFSKDSMNIVSCGADGFTRVFSTQTGLCRCTLNSDTTSIPAFAKFADNNQFLLVDTLANKIQLWDWQQQELRQIYSGIQNDAGYMESFMIRDQHQLKQRYLLGLSDRTQIIIWDIVTANILKIQPIKTSLPMKLYQKDGLQSNGFFLYCNDSHQIFKYSLDITQS